MYKVLSFVYSTTQARSGGTSLYFQHLGSAVEASEVQEYPHVHSTFNASLPLPPKELDNTCTIALGFSLEISNADTGHTGLHRCPLCITTSWMLMWPLLSSVDQGIHS